MIKDPIRYLFYGVLFCLVLSFVACAGAPLPIADSLSLVEPQETIVVGKIILEPPLETVEQDLKTVKMGKSGLMINPYAKRFVNKVFLLTDKEMRNLHNPSPRDYRNRIEAELGEIFYVRAPNNPIYVIGTEIIMGFGSSGVKKASLPAGYKINIKKADKAVYIGTIKYYRDEFFDIQKIELLDEYTECKTAFKKKFGDQVALRKSIVLPQ